MSFISPELQKKCMKLSLARKNHHQDTVSQMSFISPELQKKCMNVCGTPTNVPDLVQSNHFELKPNGDTLGWVPIHPRFEEGLEQRHITQGLLFLYFLK